MDLVSDIVGIAGLLHDPALVGGGLHQILPGGFLDVHTDYNFHPQTKLHRRLNLLLYMNKDWKREYEGYLELWDMDAKKQIEDIAPAFNRGGHLRKRTRSRFMGIPNRSPRRAT